MPTVRRRIQVDSLSKEQADLQGKIDVASKQLGELKPKLQTTEEELRTAERTAADGARELELLKQENQRLSHLLTQLRDRVNALKSNLPQAEARIAELEVLLRRLQQQ